MEINLYPCFKHWFYNSRASKNSIWLFSDPHFADKDSQFFRKNYIDDDELVKRINSKISKNDTLICLGDVGDITFIKKLRGYKVLVMGNHDSGASNYKRAVKEIEHNSDTCPHCGAKVTYDLATFNNMGFGWAWCSQCGSVKPKPDVEIDNHLFDEVYEGTLQISPKIILSHEPINYKYCFNIHGHDHSGYSEENHLNLCVEHINYTPINLTTIIKKGVLKNIPDIHKETIRAATEKKNK